MCGHARHRCHCFVGAPVVTRWFYRQRIEGSLTRTQRPWILLLDPGVCSAWQGTPGSITPELIDVPISIVYAAPVSVARSRRLPTSRQFAQMPNCYSSPVRDGPRNRKMADARP